MEIGAIREWHNLVGIDLPVGHVVVFFDVLHVDGLFHTRNGSNRAKPAKSVGTILDRKQVAFKVTKVNGIEAKDRGVEANVSLS